MSNQPYDMRFSSSTTASPVPARQSHYDDLNVLNKDASTLESIIKEYERKLEYETQIRNKAQLASAGSSDKRMQKDAARQVEFSNKRIEILSLELNNFLRRFSEIKESIYKKEVDNLQRMLSSLRGTQRSDRLDPVSKINASISSMSIEDASSREKEIAELKSQLLELSKEKRDLESKLVSQTSVQRSLPSENVPKTPPPRIPLPGLQKSTQALDSLAESLLAESMRNSIQPSSAISPTNTNKTTIFSDYSARLTASQPETVKNWIETTVTVDISQIRDLQATYSETIWKLGELFMGIEYEVANSIKLALALKAYQSGMNKYPPSDAARRRLSEHANDFDSLLLVLIQIISVMMWEKEKLRIPLSIPTENQAQLIITFLADQFRSNKKPVLPSDVASAEVTRLEGENRKLSAENQETANKYRDLDKKYQEALDSIEYLKNQKRSLSAQLKVQAATIEKQAESESKIKQLESQLSKNNQTFQNKLETLSTENVELARRISEMQRENDNYKRKESEWENSRSFNNLETKDNSADVEELNKVKVELEESTRYIVQLKEYLDSLESDKEDLEKQIVGLRTGVSNEVKDLTIQLEQSQRKVTDLTKRLNETDSSYQAVSSRLLELEAKEKELISISKRQTLQYEEEVRGLKDQLASFTSSRDVDDAGNQIQKLNNEPSENSELIRENTELKTQLRNQAMDLRRFAENQKREYDELLESLKDEISRLLSVNEDLTMQLKEKDPKSDSGADVAKLKSQLDDTFGYVRSLEAELDTMSNRLASDDIVINELELQVQKLEEKLQQTLEATSPSKANVSTKREISGKKEDSIFNDETESAAQSDRSPENETLATATRSMIISNYDFGDSPVSSRTPSPLTENDGENTDNIAPPSLNVDLPERPLSFASTVTDMSTNAEENERIKHLQSQLDKSRAEIAILESHLEKSRAMMENLTETQNELEKNREEMEELKKQLQAKESHLLSLENESTVLRLEIEEAKAKRENAEKLLQKVESERDELRANLENVKEERDIFESHLQKSQSIIEHQTTAESEYLKEIETLKTQLRSTSFSNTRVTRDLDNAEEKNIRLMSLEQSVDILSNDLKTLEDEKAKLEELASELRANILSLEGEKVQLNEKIDQLSVDLQTEKCLNEKIASEIKSLSEIEMRKSSDELAKQDVSGNDEIRSRKLEDAFELSPTSISPADVSEQSADKMQEESSLSPLSPTTAAFSSLPAPINSAVTSPVTSPSFMSRSVPVDEISPMESVSDRGQPQSPSQEVQAISNEANPSSQSPLPDAESKLNQALKDLELSRSEVVSLQTQLDDLNAALSKQTNALEDLEITRQELTRVQNILQDKEEEISQLNTSMQQSQNGPDSAEIREIDQATVYRNVTDDAEVDALKKEVDSLKSSLGKKKQELEDTMVRVESLQQTIEVLSVEVENFEQENTELKEQLSARNAQSVSTVNVDVQTEESASGTRTLNQTDEDLFKTVEVFELTKGNLEQKVRSLEKEVEDTRVKYQEIFADIQTEFEKSNQELEAKLKDVEQKYAEAQDRLQNVETSSRNVPDVIDASGFEDRIRLLENELDEMKENRRLLSEELAVAKDKESDLLATIETIRSELVEIRSERDALFKSADEEDHSDSRMIDEKMAELEKQNSNLTMELHDIRSHYQSILADIEKENDDIKTALELRCKQAEEKYLEMKDKLELVEKESRQNVRSLDIIDASPDAAGRDLASGTMERSLETEYRNIEHPQRLDTEEEVDLAKEMAVLRQEYDTVKDQLMLLEKEKADLAESYRQLTEELGEVRAKDIPIANEFNGEQPNFQERYDHVKKEKDELAEAHLQALEELATAQSNQRRLTAEIDQLKHKLTNLKVASSSSESEAVDATVEGFVNDNVESLNARISQLEKANDNLVEDLNQTQAKYQSILAEMEKQHEISIKALQDKCEEAEKKYLQDKENQGSNINASRSMDNNETTSDFIDTSTDVGSHTQDPDTESESEDMHGLKSNFDTVQARELESTKELDELRQNLSMTTEKWHSKEQEWKETESVLRLELDAARSKYDESTAELQQELTSIKRERDALAENHQSVLNELEALKLNERELTLEIENLRSKLLEKENEETGQSDSLKSRVAELESVNANLKAGIEEIRIRYEGLLADAQKQYEVSLNELETRRRDAEDRYLTLEERVKSPEAVDRSITAVPDTATDVDTLDPDTESETDNQELRYRELEVRLDELQSKEKALLSELEQLRNSLASSTERIDLLEQKRLDQDNNLRSVTMELEDKRAMEEQLKLEREDLQRAHDDLLERLEEFENGRNDLLNQIEQRKQDLESSEVQRNELSSQLETALLEIKQAKLLNQEMEERADELSILKAELEAAKTLVTELRQSEENSREKLQSVQSRADSMDAQLTDLTQKLNVATDREHDLLEELDAVREERDVLQQTIERFESEVGDLSSVNTRLLELNQENGDLKVQLETVQMDLTNLRSSKADLESTIRSLESQLQESQVEADQISSLEAAKLASESDLLQLREDMVHLEKENNDLQLRIQSLIEENEALTSSDTVEQLQKINGALQGDIAQLKNEKEDLQTKLESLQKQHKDATLTSANHAQHIQEMESQLLAAKDQIMELEKTNSELQSQLQSLDEKLKASLVDSDHNSKRLSAEKEELESKLDSAAKEISVQQSRHQALAAELESALSSNAELSSEIESLKAKNTHLTEELKLLQAQIEDSASSSRELQQVMESNKDELNSALQQAQSERNALQSANDELQLKIKSLQGQIDEKDSVSADELKALEEENSTLKSDLRNTREEVTRLEAARQNQIEELNALQTQNATLESKLVSLQQQIESSDTQITTLQTENQSLQSQMSSLKASTDSIPFLENEIKNLQIANSELMTKITSLQSTNQDLSDDIDNLKQSLSQQSAKASSQVDVIQTMEEEHAEQVKSLKLNIQEMSRQFEELQKQKVSVENEVAKLKENLKARDEDLSSFLNDLNTVQMKCADLTSENEDLKTKLEQLKAQAPSDNSGGDGGADGNTKELEEKLKKLQGELDTVLQKNIEYAMLLSQYQ